MLKLFLDANALYSITLTDLLLLLHERGACSVSCSVYYSTYVEEEALRNLVSRAATPDIAHRVRKRFAATAAFVADDPDGTVHRLDSGLVSPTGSILPDPDDEQVLADAYSSTADHLLTHNTRDFPPEAATQLGLVVLRPDAGLIRIARSHPDMTLAAVYEFAAKRRSPRQTKSSIVERLRRSACPRFAEYVHLHYSP